MYCEWPEFRRCCFCLPLRRGILILAYVNILCGILETTLFFTMMGGIYIHRTYSALPFALNITLFILDVVTTIGLLVGLHMKHELLVKIYFNFMIVSLSASVPLTIIDIAMMDYVHSRVFSVFYFILTSVLNIYLLLLVRSMVKKLQVSDGNTFGNRLADFVEGSTEAEQNHTVTIPLPEDNS